MMRADDKVGALPWLSQLVLGAIAALVVGCHRAPPPAFVDGEGFAGGDPAWNRVLLDRGALIATLEQLRSGAVDPQQLCTPCVLAPDHIACRHVAQLSESQRSDARAFLLDTYRSVYDLLLRNPHSLFQLSDTSWTIDGDLAVARTPLGLDGFIQFFATAWLSMHIEDSEATMSHETGHKVVFTALGRPLDDTDRWGAFTSSRGGKELLNGAGNCMVAQRLEHPMSYVVASASQLTVDPEATASASALALTNRGPAVTVTGVTLSPPFVLTQGCATGALVAPGCTAQLSVAAGTAAGSYHGSATFTFSQGQQLTVSLVAHLAEGTRALINADNNLVNQTHPCNTPSKLSFSSKSQDSAGYFDTTRSRFTPGAGRWLVSAATRLSGNSYYAAGASLQLSLYKNGALYRSGPLSRTNRNTYGASLTHTVDAQPGDYFEIYATRTGCSGNAILIGAQSETWLELAAVPNAGTLITADNDNVPQAIGCGATSKLGFSTAHGDTGSLFDTTQSRFTPGAGRWLVTAAVPFSDAPPWNSLLDLMIYKNGTVLKRGARSVGPGSRQGAGISYVIDAQAGDYFELYARYGSCTGGALNLSGAVTDTWLQLTPLPAPTPLHADFGGAAHSAPCGGWGRLSFPVKSGDPSNLFDTTRSRFTPGTGQWLIQATTNVAGDPGLDSFLQLGIFKNGAALKNGAMSTTAINWLGASVSYIVDAKPDDYFEIQVRYGGCSVSSVSLQPSAADTWLEITRWDAPL